MDEKHPEDVTPLGDSHPQLSITEKRTLLWLSISLAATLIALPIIAVLSLSPIGNVFLGLLPLLLTIVLDIVVLTNKYKRAVFWAVLFIVHFIALGALTYLNVLLPSPMNVPQVIVLSFFLGLLVTFIAWLIEGGIPQRQSTYRRPPPQEFSVEALPEFVHSIEDKCKALNFAVGRVYRNSSGGSAKLRERLRIPREWYNEFNTDASEDRIARAAVLVEKIHDRLRIYTKPEHEVFTHEELARLKHKRKENATVLDVLTANDSDPVEQYYRSALETCEQILKGIGHHH